jgi:hypothetical protein
VRANSAATISFRQPRLRGCVNVSDYTATTLLTTSRSHATGFASSLIEGRLRRRS